MKIQWKKLLGCIALPLAVGAASALLTMNGMEAFDALEKPPLTPSGWIFPVVWTILYVMMGIASYLVLTSGKQWKGAIAVYALQLFFNFFWSILFFGMGAYLGSFVWLVLLWVLILLTALLFYGISKPAGYLMLPYLLWVAFAGYLNIAIYFLNR